MDAQRDLKTVVRYRRKILEQVKPVSAIRCGTPEKQHLQSVYLLRFVHRTVRWTVPQDAQWLLRKGADPIQQLDKFTLPGQGQDLHLMIPL